MPLRSRRDVKLYLRCTRHTASLHSNVKLSPRVLFTSYYISFRLLLLTMPTGHTPKLKRKRAGLIRQSISSLRPTKTLCVDTSQSQDKSLGEDSRSTASDLISRLSTPSSSRASTPFENAELRSNAHPHTSISVFPQGDRLTISVKRAVSGYKSASEPPVEMDVTDRDEDYEDVSYQDAPLSVADEADAWVDTMPKPETRPAKRSRTTDKATTVSPWAITYTNFTDFIIKRKKPLEDFICIRDTLLLELCRHEGLRGLAVELSGFPLCGECGELDGTLRCTECTIDAMFCPRCMCAKHREQPLHRIQVRRYCACPVKINLKVYIALDGHIFCHAFTG